MDIKHSANSTAAEWLGKIEPGFRQFGFSRGQWSYGDLIDAVIRQQPGGELDVISWTISAPEAERLCGFIRDGYLKSLRIVVDYSMAGLDANRIARGQALEKLLGKDGIRTTRVHAKVASYRVSGLDIALRSSANYNRNPRIEQWDIEDSAPICSEIVSLVSEIFDSRPPGILSFGVDAHWANLSFGNMETGKASADLGVSAWDEFSRW